MGRSSEVTSFSRVPGYFSKTTREGRGSEEKKGGAKDRGTARLAEESKGEKGKGAGHFKSTTCEQGNL